jgi:Ca2+-transporting ATPase
LISLGVIFNFYFALQAEVSLERGRTIAMTTMVLFQFFQAWNSRSELESVFRINPLSNPFLFYSMVASFLAQIAVIYVPALQWVFRTEALSAGEWLQIVLVSLSVVAAVEIDKALRRRRQVAGAPA